MQAFCHFMAFWHVCQKANCITKSAFSRILRAIIENIFSPDYVLCYIPRVMAMAIGEVYYFKITFHSCKFQGKTFISFKSTFFVYFSYNIWILRTWDFRLSSSARPFQMIFISLKRMMMGRLLCVQHLGRQATPLVLVSVHYLVGLDSNEIWII